MPIIVKYNNDIGFRRQTAFRRVYRGKSFRARAIFELGIMTLCVIATVLLLSTGWGRQMPVFALYGAAMVGIYLLARFLRTLFNVSKIQDGEAGRAQRQFYFDEAGFSFGPVDRDGTMLETRWQDIDKAYMSGGVIYFLCMNRRHWAAVDRRLVVEGSWAELMALINEKLPKGKRAY